MKKLFFQALCIALLTLAACERKADITGVWQGTAKDPMSGVATSNITVNYDFGSDGAVLASYEFEFSEPMQPNGQIVSPYQVNVAGTATVAGRWQYVDGEDDEVAISYDLTTIRAKIDPEAVVLSENVFSGQQQPQVDSLKASLQQKYTAMITTYLKNNPSEVWDDVKVKKPLLKYEIHHKDYILHQVTPQ